MQTSSHTLLSLLCTFAICIDFAAEYETRFELRRLKVKGIKRIVGINFAHLLSVRYLLPVAFSPHRRNHATSWVHSLKWRTRHNNESEDLRKQHSSKPEKAFTL